MKNSELEELLKKYGLPELNEDYWHGFAKRATGQILLRKARRPLAAEGRPVPRQTEDAWRFFPLVRKRIVTFAIVTGCMCAAMVSLLLIRNGELQRRNKQQLANAKKYYEEIATLFPNQLRAIIFDQAGAHLELADRPTVPASPPIYLKICEGSGCQRFITFSGQKIRVHEELCDVLTDRRGAVLLVGESWIWSSSEPSRRSGAYRIEAKVMGTSS